MGSTTYEWMLRHTEEVVASVGSPWPYTQPTLVFSTRPVALLKGNDIRIARGDVRPVHAEMRAAAGSKNIWIGGGGDLAGQFNDAGLLNEIIVQIGSVTLGRGKQLFPRRVTNPPLRLISTQQIASGFADLRYEVQTGQVSEDAATGG
jgi:dihydrofolate reductase